MISGTITISNIEYEKCFQSFFPAAVRKINTIENPAMTLRFINKMEDDLLPVMLKILNYMSDEEKEKLLLGMIDMLEEPICGTLNRFLSNQETKDAIRIGRIGALKEKDTENLFLVITGVRIDYDSLIKTSFVNQNIDAWVNNMSKQAGLKGSGFLREAAKIALRAGVKAAPKEVERKGIDLLNRPDIRERAVSVISEGLKKVGLYLTVRDFSLVQETISENQSKNQAEDKLKGGFKLSEEMEEILLNVGVRYLRGAVKRVS